MFSLLAQPASLSCRLSCCLPLSINMSTLEAYYISHSREESETIEDMKTSKLVNACWYSFDFVLLLLFSISGYFWLLLVTFGYLWVLCNFGDFYVCFWLFLCLYVFVLIKHYFAISYSETVGSFQFSFNLSNCTCKVWSI